MSRVCIFGERLKPPLDEGIKKLTLNLADVCRALGHEVRVLTTGAPDWPEMGVEAVQADKLLRSSQLAGAFAAWRPTAVVYVPTASLTLASGVRSRTLKRYAGAPVALFATQGRRHRKPVQMAARFVAPDLCVAQSAATVEQARLLGWPAELLPPGVDLATFRPVSTDRKAILRRQFGLAEDEFVVLHVGHLNRGRGVADLLAVTDLARPVLACSTSTVQDMELAGELRTKGVSVFSDFIPKIADLYAAADAYLFPVPPDPEGPSSIDVPLSVLEAAACGLPVVTTRFGALPGLWPQVAMEGMNGGDLLYYDDIDGLRRAVVRLRDARTGSAGPAGARHLVEPFGWEALARRLLQRLTAGGTGS